MFRIFVQPNNLVVLSGAVIFAGIIEFVDGGCNDGMLANEREGILAELGYMHWSWGEGSRVCAFSCWALSERGETNFEDDMDVCSFCAII